MNLVARVVQRFLERQGKGDPYKGWEHRKERDEAVMVNLPPHLLPLWKRTQYLFKGTPEQRAQHFLEYVHNHPGEETESVQREADKALTKMIRQHRDDPYMRARPPSYELPSMDDGIPFSAGITRR